MKSFGGKRQYRRISGDSIASFSKQFIAPTSRGENPQADLNQLWKDLQGDWVGVAGWNLIAVPSEGFPVNGSGNFDLLVAPYSEHFMIKNAGAPARNRGGLEDQFVSALEYHQRVMDKKTGELLHIETGMFLDLVKITSNDGGEHIPPEFSIARSGTIPHGNSILMLGNTEQTGAGKLPKFDIFNASAPDNKLSMPQNTFSLTNYTLPYVNNEKDINPKLPDFITKSPDATLKQLLDNQLADGHKLLSTSTMILDTDNVAKNAGILNIPFINNHTQTPRMRAAFWLEKMEDKDGNQFDQLQYIQVIDLLFQQGKNPDEHGGHILWPHVTINTMVKQ